VNNAGIAGPTAPLEETTDGEWIETLDVNVVGVARVTREAAPHLRESEQGSVINISSIGGKRPYANRGPYAASKMGLIGVTRALAAEFGDDGVTANAICPGPVEGERIRGVFERQAEAAGVSAEAVEGEVLESLMIDELVPPAEVADMAVHLASADSRHVTGQDINVSSGGAWYCSVGSGIAIEFRGRREPRQAGRYRRIPAARPTEPDRRANLLALVFEAPGRDDERRLLGPRRTYPSAVSVSSPRTTARRRLGPRSPDTCRAWWSSRRR